MGTVPAHNKLRLQERFAPGQPDDLASMKLRASHVQLDDDILTIGAAQFELGIPLTMLAICYVRPSTRDALFPALGVLAPMLLVYAWCSFSYLALGNEDVALAFYAQWYMSSLAYCVLLVVGLAFAAVMRRRFGTVKKLFAGFIVGVGTLVGLTGVV